MKTQINEIKRMQKLAGIINEAIGDDIALKFSNTKPNTPPGATPGETPGMSITNTSDEQAVKKILDQSPQVVAKLNNINNVVELDGFFRTMLSYTKLQDVQKSQIINALSVALKDINKDGSTISTGG